jgi:hypothetical protein
MMMIMMIMNGVDAVDGLKFEGVWLDEFSSSHLQISSTLSNLGFGCSVPYFKEYIFPAVYCCIRLVSLTFVFSFKPLIFQSVIDKRHRAIAN